MTETKIKEVVVILTLFSLMNPVYNLFYTLFFTFRIPSKTNVMID